MPCSTRGRVVSRCWRTPGAGLADLARQGLNLQFIFDCATLPGPLASALDRAAPGWREFPRLLLIGNGGPAFWRQLSARGLSGADPVDRYSRWQVERLLTDYWGAPRVRWLYPDPTPVPLQQLGALAGWHHPSPLGIGINERYGLWFAYRAAVLVDLELPPSVPWGGSSPCASCSDKPCIRTCPAGAAATGQVFAVARCHPYRHAPQSPCAATCLARLACPVAPEMRYSDDQLAYHYTQSLVR